MRRSNLQTISRKKTPESLKNIINKRTIVVSYIKKERKAFFSNLNPNKFVIIKYFGGTFSRFFLIKEKFLIKSL